MVARQGRFGGIQYIQAAQEPNETSKIYLSRDLRRIGLGVPKRVVPARQLLLDRDDGNGNFARVVRGDVGANLHMAVLVQRQNIGVEYVANHAARASR